MDNITHSLVGLALGEGAYRVRKREGRPALFQAGLWFTSWVANNAPDLDYLYYFLLKGDRLDILLNHRGYTHTLIGAIPQICVALIPLWILARLTKTKFDVYEWFCFVSVSLLGGVAHILLDSMNGYGIHPYWPWSNRWIYNDIIFIVEPWLWISLIPALFRAAPWRWVKVVLGAILVAGIGLEWGSGFVPWKMALIVTLWTVGLSAIVLRPKAVFPFFHAWASFFTVILIFALVGRTIRKSIEIDFQHASGIHLKDVILTPMPSNPFCWSVIAVDTSSLGIYYQVRKGLVTPIPKFISASQCPDFRYQWGKRDDTLRVHWMTETERQVGELIKWKEAHCGVKTFLQFSRAPLLEELKTSVVFDDARFMWKSSAGFTHFDVPKIPGSCPKYPVPWLEPRADLWEKIAQ